MPYAHNLQSVVNIIALEKDLGKCPRHITPLEAKLTIEHGGAIPTIIPLIIFSITCSVESCPASKVFNKRLFSWADKDPNTAMYYMLKDLVREYRESELKRVFK